MDFNNSAEIFRKMYDTEYKESLEESSLRIIAEIYHKECDAFDFVICGGVNPRTGEPTPVTNSELHQINKNARKVKERLVNQNPQFTAQDIHKAILNCGKYWGK